MVSSFADLGARLSTYFLQFRLSKLLTTVHFCELACFCFCFLIFIFLITLQCTVSHGIDLWKHLSFILLPACLTSVNVVPTNIYLFHSKEANTSVTHTLKLWHWRRRCCWRTHRTGMNFPNKCRLPKKENSN